jgi:hypothetical protein
LAERTDALKKLFGVVSGDMPGGGNVRKVAAMLSPLACYRFLFFDDGSQDAHVWELLPELIPGIELLRYPLLLTTIALAHSATCAVLRVCYFTRV